jgi:membrane protein DedA with SNARE-associated domain
LETTILTILQSIFDQVGWVGVFVLMIFENATGISPSEIILAFAGWMLIERHGISPSFIFLAGLYAGFGSAVGASITYWVARIGGIPMVEKFAKIFRINMSTIKKAEDQMNKWGAGIILFGRMLPAVRTLINIPAGLAKVPFLKFFVATFIGAYIWCTVLIGAGYVLGHEWVLVSEYIKTHIPLVLSIVILGVSLYLMYHFREQLLPWVFAYFPKNKKRLDEKK